MLKSEAKLVTRFMHLSKLMAKVHIVSFKAGFLNFGFATAFAKILSLAT